MVQAEGQKFRVLVADDDSEMRDSLAHLLGKTNWEVETVAGGEQAISRFDQIMPDVVLSDVRMPGMSGLELLQNLHKGIGEAQKVPVVLISAHGDIPMAVAAMQQGAYSFIEKPFDPNRLLSVLKHAASQHRQGLQTQRLRARLLNLSGLDRILLGETDAIKAMREDIMDLGESESPVMLLGETGTGKELVARALHDLGPRAGGPFVALNCAAIPLEHFETTMFGSVDGEHGALARGTLARGPLARGTLARGTLANVDTGTLFLDEIGTCPPQIQAKLLRVIETQEFSVVGSSKSTSVNFRVVSASNEQLDQAVEEGRFRRDLFYRLNNVVLQLPPLRERREDITLLYAHFLEQQAAVYEIVAPQTSADDLAALLSHDWPGNVRELRHVAERRILAARRGRGSVAEAIQPDMEIDGVPETLRGAIAAFERQLISGAIKTHQGRMDAVAEALGIGRRTLNEKIVKLGLKKDELL
ncbi:C4-dicarboxylate transport transcriptional regulatory protein DctD [hydrothermal vent metagenome]|uniref:C4-dicarboxylate transport transcriptional regulatory protein DctD n=1 Tax=hydrothermal vent metagenome TaxID=652676 RepID=A0A3B0ULF8_9ZZZZ